MSWGINLSGPKKFVEDELTDANEQIRSALYAVQRRDPDSLVNVSVSGSAYSSPDGTGGGGASFNVATYLPPEPPPSPDPEVVQAAPSEDDLPL